VVRFESTFGALILAQAAHSIEESLGRLWESFPPARFVAGLVSTDHERGFVILNVLLVGFGAWCYLWPIRRHWAVAMSLGWFWVVLETINGIVHPLWSVMERGYTPGLATAPVLLILAIYLASHLRRRTPGAPTAG
jgi:Protein of unknown function with HXXEE motif